MSLPVDENGELIPLDLHIQPKNITVGDMRKMSDKNTSVVAFSRVLARFSNWKEEQIDDLTIEELEPIIAQFNLELEKATPPKAK
jgi:hypothetical protein